MSVLYHNKWHSSDADASKTLIARLEISIVVTAIRVGCKVMRKPRFNLKNLGWDDYLILLALLCNTTTEVLMFWGEACAKTFSVCGNNIVNRIFEGRFWNPTEDTYQNRPLPGGQGFSTRESCHSPLLN